jgi:hypothetical protein
VGTVAGPDDRLRLPDTNSLTAEIAKKGREGRKEREVQLGLRVTFVRIELDLVDPRMISKRAAYSGHLRADSADAMGHKLRSFLTMFGIAWGVFSLLLLVGLEEGFRSGHAAGFRARRVIDRGAEQFGKRQRVHPA